MKKISSYSKLLTEDDFFFLSTKYDLTIDFVRNMNDDDWQAYLGCNKDELAFYLLADDDYASTLELTEIYETNIDEIDERYDEDSMDTLFEDTYLSEAVIDLNRFREAQVKPSHPSQAGFTPKPFVSYKPQKPAKPVPVSHHLEVVF